MLRLGKEERLILGRDLLLIMFVSLLFIALAINPKVQPFLLKSCSLSYRFFSVCYLFPAYSHCSDLERGSTQ